VLLAAVGEPVTTWPLTALLALDGRVKPTTTEPEVADA